MEPAEILPSGKDIERGHEASSYNQEHAPRVDDGGVERGLDNGAEKRERASEAAASIADSSFPTTLPMPVMSDDDSQVSSSTSGASDNDTPLVAGDEDLIEKEWVDKAKKIVNQTKQNPYLQEEEVNKLQRDYQQKRYGESGGGV